MGAMLGTAYGDVAGLLVPHLIGQPGAYGLVGTGAVFAGAGRAPITSVLIIFELTGDYRVILPLMVAVVISTAVASLLGPDSIYTLKLRRRGIELRHQNTPLMQRLTVADAMRAVPTPIAASAPVSGAARPVRERPRSSAASRRRRRSVRGDHHAASARRGRRPSQTPPRETSPCPSPP